MSSDTEQIPQDGLPDEETADNYLESGYSAIESEGDFDGIIREHLRCGRSPVCLASPGETSEYVDTRNLIEVEFKGSRRGFYWNDQDIPLGPSDFVIMEADRGVDIGMLYLMGETVQIKRKNRGINTRDVRKVLRKATKDDILRMEENLRQEGAAASVCRQKILNHKLDMKLVDVEFQFDKSRITFYFTAEQRVDFRELVKDLAAEYKTRIELRQIGVRDEAQRIGGVGVCGLELCCSSWLLDFKRITTQHAKAQMLPLNPAKLSGQCGRLKCCLIYELKQE
jgi:cell fate regulator YaaT (PSP1 superfamily)